MCRSAGAAVLQASSPQAVTQDCHYTQLQPACGVHIGNPPSPRASAQPASPQHSQHTAQPAVLQQSQQSSQLAQPEQSQCTAEPEASLHSQCTSQSAVPEQSKHMAQPASVQCVQQSVAEAAKLEGRQHAAQQKAQRRRPVRGLAAPDYAVRPVPPLLLLRNCLADIQVLPLTMQHALCSLCCCCCVTVLLQLISKCCMTVSEVRKRTASNTAGGFEQGDCPSHCSDM